MTVSGRPVAELVPLAARPRSIDWGTFVLHADEWRADPEMARDLAELLPDTTDDVALP